MSTPERLEAVEDAILRADPPVVTAPEIAEVVLEESSVYDSVGDPRREALADLSLLERSATVASKRTGARARAFWHTDRVRPPPTPVDEISTDADPALDAVDRPEPRQPDAVRVDHAGDAPGRARDVDDELEAALAEWDPGRSREERLERVEAGVAALEWLRRQPGPVRRADVVAETFDELAPGEQNEDAYWRKSVRPAYQHAADAGLVEIEGKSYEWTG